MMERRRGDGLVYQRLTKVGEPYWYCRWWQNGESAYGSPAKELGKAPTQVTRQEAERYLRKMIRLKQSPTPRPSAKVMRITGRTVIEAYQVHLEIKAKTKAQADLPAHLIARKQRSLRGTFRELAVVAEWLGDAPAAQAFEYAQLEALVNEQLDRYKLSTVRSRMALATAACRTAVTKRLLPTMPVFPELPKQRLRREEEIALEQHRMIRARFVDPVDRKLVEYLHLSGWRVSEPMDLTWPMLIAKPSPHLWLPSTKTDRGRLMPIVLPEMIVLIDELKRDRRVGCPFLFHRNGRQLVYSTFWTHWRAACEAAGLPEKIPHDYRRSIYDRLLEAGVPAEIAMMLVGHDDRQTMRRYNPRDLPQMVKALKQLAEYENQCRTGAAEVRGWKDSSL